MASGVKVTVEGGTFRAVIDRSEGDSWPYFLSRTMAAINSAHHSVEDEQAHLHPQSASVADEKMSDVIARELRDLADELESGEYLAERMDSSAGLIETTKPGDTDKSWIQSGVYRVMVEFSDPKKRSEVPAEFRDRPIHWGPDEPTEVDGEVIGPLDILLSSGC